MSFESLDRKIWKLWKQGKSLTEIVDYIAEYTHWSRYMALVHLVRYLHKKNKITFTIEQLRKAFEQTTGDFNPEDEEGSWEFLLEKAEIS